MHLLLLLACTGEPTPADDSSAPACENGAGHSAGEATPIAEGVVQAVGATCADGTADWWSFTVDAPGWYTLDTTASDSDAARVLFTVVNPAEESWTVSLWQPGTQAYYLDSAGTWYVKVAATGADAPIAYGFYPSRVEGPTSAEEAVESVSVAADSSTRVAIPLESAGDVDEIEITAVPGSWLTVRKDPLYQGARMADVTLSFVAADGTPLGSSTTTDSWFVPFRGDPVRLSVGGNAAGWAGVELRIGEAFVTETEPNDTQEMATEFGDLVVFGEVNADGDEEWYHGVVTEENLFTGAYCTTTASALDTVSIEFYDADGLVGSGDEQLEKDMGEGDVWIRLTGATAGVGYWYSCTLTTTRPPTWEGE